MRREGGRRRAVWGATLAAFGASLAGCSGWNPSRPFDREAPAVGEAVAALDAGDAAVAAARLEDYLSTGPCKDGSIGTPDLLARRPDGTFDLGLSLFRLGEQYGRRFGDEEIDAGVSEASRARRHAEVTCARRLVDAISDDPGAGSDLRARARYLDGNLAFLDGEYEDAVRSYDRALTLSPGQVDAGDPIGRDAAWNRAIALRRIDDAKDAGTPDAAHDGGGDASSSPDAGRDAGGDHDAGSNADSGSGDHDAGHDAGNDASPPPPHDEPDAGEPPAPEAGAPPPPSDQDERILDQLENTPTLQQEEAKRVGKRHVRGMVDK